MHARYPCSHFPTRFPPATPFRGGGWGVPDAGGMSALRSWELGGGDSGWIALYATCVLAPASLMYVQHFFKFGAW